jgi:uncharacterized protein
MAFLVISDLHVPDRAKNIPREIIEQARISEGVIYAGDFTGLETYEKLKSSSKNLIAVRGNCDRLTLPEFVIFEEGGKKIGVLHSHHFGRGNISALEELAKSKGLDIIIFGHSHMPHIEKRGNILLINPGSANGIVSGRGESAGRTYILLDLEGEPKAVLKKIG